MTMCTQIHLFKATYWLSISESHISQCSKWEKGANHVTIIRVLHSSRIDYHYICALKYVYSKATYPLSMIESHHFTV